jgi:thioester reductase-like protein/acyl carrier protein
MEIISDESGVSVTDLTDDTNFADVGVDSLLGLTISARFREQLDLDLDFNGLFFEYPTVKDLQTFLKKTFPNVTPDKPIVTGNTKEKIAHAEITPPKTPEPSESGSDSRLDFTAALKIISEESGIDMADLDDEANLADCGVDSLLSLIIVSRFKNELDLDVESDTMFLDHPTVGDLKRTLLGKSEDVATPVQPVLDVTPVNDTSDQKLEANGSRQKLEGADNVSLAARKAAIDTLVTKYTANFSVPTSNENAPLPNTNEKVVLVTGGSGSLGGHLVYHLAQLPDVKTVVCLNRKHREDALPRQIKAMREKGIRFPEDLKHKLLVLQTESSLPLLGLQKDQYEKLASEVTHLIHQAWPMSATRPLNGFEPQFAVMRNLLDFAVCSASKRPTAFKFNFQMVSSIGVVGLYQSPSANLSFSTTHVPEARASIDSVLPNGYSEAKFGMELMLDLTLHLHASRFIPMVCRLGQIAGSKTSGYWNPMEHFGFLVKSSQTLGALPDVEGKLYWTPVNDVAASLSDIVLREAEEGKYAVYHIDHPTGQSWSEMNAHISKALKIPTLVPFREWLDRVRAAPQKNNPALLLAEFLESNYLRMSCGGLVLDVAHSVEQSKTLREIGPVPEKVVRKYIHIWKEIGFLETTQEDRDGFEKERKALWG